MYQNLLIGAGLGTSLGGLYGLFRDKPVLESALAGGLAGLGGGALYDTLDIDSVSALSQLNNVREDILNKAVQGNVPQEVVSQLMKKYSPDSLYPNMIPNMALGGGLGALLGSSLGTTPETTLMGALAGAGLASYPSREGQAELLKELQRVAQ